MRILLVEDTSDVAQAISESMARAGIACDIAESLADARACLDVQTYDVIVLDINLPDGVGTDLLIDLRRTRNPTPILMLTAQFEVDDRITALNQGADDYLVKPCDLRELEARVHALMRRNHGERSPELAVGQLVFDPSARSVRVRGAPVALTRRELTLLHTLLRNQGRIMGKEQLFDSLFSFDEGNVGLNAVELYVARLRKKLAGSGVTIETLRGLGYRLHENG